MGIISSASSASAWRGYNYYQDKRVKNIVKISDDEYEAKVQGTQSKAYDVKININHIRQSKCNCPHADGRRVICKHIVALFFEVFPKEAELYIKEVEEYEAQEEQREEERCYEIKKYVYSLKKEELRMELLELLLRDEYY